MTAEATASTALAAYRAKIDGRDELTAATGLRPEQVLLADAISELGADGLAAARAELALLVRDEGILYGAHGRNWSIDPLPLILTSAEWERLAAGLAQRARVLGMLLADIYGEQRLLASGAVPPQIVWGHQGFLPPASGIPTPREDWLPLVACDLGRDPSGAWTVLGDRTEAPAGAGYAMANRRLTSRVMGELHLNARPARLRSYFAAMRATLQQLAPRRGHTPKGVLLWSGAKAPTAYEQGFIATLLGYALVEAEDLVIRDGQVWIDSPDGRGLVDVILRRVDSGSGDPLEFRGDPGAGVAGLLEATRLGNVVNVNPLGAGVLENPAIVGLLPTLTRQLLGEDLILPSATTWWCGDAVSLSHALANLQGLLIKPIDRGPGPTAIPGWELTAAQRAELSARIKARPWAWCAQEPLPLSTAPVVTGDGLVPRRLALRTFGVQTEGGYQLLPGGLARVATDDGFLLGRGQFTLSKDVWVMDPDDAAETWQSTYDADSLTASRPSQVAPRIADNLVWLGRYAERADSSARLLRRALDLAQDHGHRPGTRGAQVLTAVLEAAERILAVDLGSGEATSARERIRSAVTDGELRGSLAHSVRRLSAAAHEVPDLMSDDIWHVLGRLDELVEGAKSRRDLAGALDAMVASTLALAGINAESLTRDATWAFIDAGMRIERAQRTLALLEHTLGRERAAVVEQQLADAVAEIGESLITKRRLAASGAARRRPGAAVTHLLVADAANPRSVAFQLDRLRGDLLLIGDDTLSDRVERLARTVSDMDVAAAFDEDRARLAAALAGHRVAVRGIADELARTHLTRVGTRRAVVTGWTPAGGRR
uniref:circularly permuted type 2 ATP-grasp protein n=1 Tax=Tessaracoccus bendigoensis TaxID=72764 RepID=UPI001587FF1F|nr:circularly permuted type 2 ATP-grasp protein [Tessaracoccus bendigoensis]